MAGINSIVPQQDHTNPEHYQLSRTNEETPHSFAMKREVSETEKKSAEANPAREMLKNPKLFTQNPEKEEELKNTVVNQVGVDNFGAEPMGLISQQEKVMSFEGSVDEFNEFITAAQYGSEFTRMENGIPIKLARTGVQLERSIKRRGRGATSIQGAENGEDSVTVRSEIVGVSFPGANMVALHLMPPEERRMEMRGLYSKEDLDAALGPGNAYQRHLDGEITRAQYYLQEDLSTPEGSKGYLRDHVNRGAIVEHVEGRSEVPPDSMMGAHYEFFTVQKRAPSPTDKVYIPYSDSANYGTIYLSIEPEDEDYPGKPANFYDITKDLIIAE